MATSRKVAQVSRLRDQVYQLIRDDLVAGIFKPGDRLVEVELAERYGVSRTPVREALFQLSRDSLLIHVSDKGYIVSKDTRKTVVQRHEIRELLEPCLVRYSAVEATDGQIEDLESSFKEMCWAHETNNLDKFVLSNVKFRSLLRAMCQNELLSRCIALVDDQVQVIRRELFTEPENRELELSHNKRLLVAIQDRDPEAAESVMREYISAVRQWALTAY